VGMSDLCSGRVDLNTRQKRLCDFNTPEAARKITQMTKKIHTSDMG
jgi:hypothetical protein